MFFLYNILNEIGPTLIIFQDVETYKTSGKEGIETWIKTLGQHNISDWMIVLVETYDFRKTNKLIPRTTVLDKIRNDFGSKHADRYVY